ncbi:ATP-dependent Clp protease adaptor ClpS [Bernardetia sp. ABR2-2B]|uniref:ATP-dependent Clp protease adaptor ClpS n=1 Tax=Bernardetia sp. ABR2-2B TaxID=3127472 RepID=UPI0030D22B41
MNQFLNSSSITNSDTDNLNYSLGFYANTETEVLEEVETKEEEGHRLIVFNDEVNTFDHVIDTLINVCEHSEAQAEQCTLIIHFKGKCSVKEGSWNDLVPMRNAICDRGISAEVD